MVRELIAPLIASFLDLISGGPESPEIKYTLHPLSGARDESNLTDFYSKFRLCGMVTASMVPSVPSREVRVCHWYYVEPERFDLHEAIVLAHRLRDKLDPEIFIRTGTKMILMSHKPIEFGHKNGYLVSIGSSMEVGLTYLGDPNFLKRQLIAFL